MAEAKIIITKGTREVSTSEKIEGDKDTQITIYDKRTLNLWEGNLEQLMSALNFSKWHVSSLTRRQREESFGSIRGMQ